MTITVASKVDSERKTCQGAFESEYEVEKSSNPKSRSHGRSLKGYSDERNPQTLKVRDGMH